MQRLLVLCSAASALRLAPRLAPPRLAKAPAVAAALTRAFRAATGVAARPVHGVVHRWRYARPALDRMAGPPCLFDHDLGIGACGDWLVGARVEGAWLSGTAMAERLLGSHTESGRHMIHQRAGGCL